MELRRTKAWAAATSTTASAGATACSNKRRGASEEETCDREATETSEGPESETRSAAGAASQSRPDFKPRGAARQFEVVTTVYSCLVYEQKVYMC